ncbi:MAG: hypothetical protein ACRDBO_16780 [Lachnospiraceae bacterium]
MFKRKDVNLSIVGLKVMVTYINKSDVPPEDVLSDQIYLYFREKDCNEMYNKGFAASD